MAGGEGGGIASGDAVRRGGPQPLMAYTHLI